MAAMQTSPRPHPGSFQIRKPVGIDLGTTNSVIAILDPTDSAILTGQDEHGHQTFPSLVGSRGADARPVAGWSAVEQPGQQDAPVRSVKRFMGLERKFAVGPDQLTPPEVSARVLALLRTVLARTVNDAKYLLDAAVITMPAYFNHNQIEATRQAGELAGYQVLELLHEPTAAAIYYGWLEGHGDATYLVYDLGGGTFDVSIIRKRFDDYEVLGVSGDPFLGGDDFDRLLASHLQQPFLDRGINFDLATPEGAANFASLVRVAEGIKIELTNGERVERYVPDLLRAADGSQVALETSVDRATFQRLIRAKVDRTIDACHEALRRASDKAAIRLGAIDHVILVGGSSRIPLVRDTVRAAFCNPQLAERARNPEPLLHEPDLCVAFGAALRAATHGTRYRFAVPDFRLGWVAGAESAKPRGVGGDTLLELHLTSPPATRETPYPLSGVVRAEDSARVDLDGGSVRVCSLATGLTDEAFLDSNGSFTQDVELQPETDNPLEVAVVDGLGRELARLPLLIRHSSRSRHLGQAVLPTQLITKPLAIEVLDRQRRRVKRVVAPVGASLPGTFACTCHTVDQAGRVVVPIFEENRVIKQMVVQDLDPALPVGSPVDVEFQIDVKHNIQVSVKVRQANDQEVRAETAAIEAAPPPRRPTRADVEEVEQQINGLLAECSGSYRTRVKARLAQLLQDLREALRYEDEPKAIQRMAELRDLLAELHARRGQALEPPWSRFTQLLRHCLDLAARVADATGRGREELFEHIYAQERYAEQAYEEQNLPLYRECFENLGKYAGYLDQILNDALPRPDRGPSLSADEEARHALEQFRGYLAEVWKKVRAAGRAELEKRLSQVAEQGRGLSQRAKSDAPGAIRESRRLVAEVRKVEDLLEGRRPAGTDEDAGLLEGTP
jgi:molecular chaperone DnaK